MPARVEFRGIGELASLHFLFRLQASFAIRGKIVRREKAVLFLIPPHPHFSCPMGAFTILIDCTY